MATDVERLVVSLEASVTKFDRAMAKASGVSDATARKIERRFASMNDRMQASFAGVGRGIATAFASAAALRGAQQLIDTSTRIENSLKVAGLAGEDLTNVYDSLFASAQRNAAPLESLVQLYGRAAIVQKELGVSTEELLGFTDNVAVALRVAGTDAQSASGALLQLSQALGAGTVRAEEFNSILEGALPVAQAAAAGLEEAGGSVAKLRALVVDGEVSSEAFFRAFEAGSVILTDKVADAELTVSQGFVRLQNVLIDVAGKFDETTGASQNLANFLESLGDSIERVSDSRAFEAIIGWLDDLGNSRLEGTARELEAIGSALEYVMSRFDRFGSEVSDAELEIASAEQALVNLAQNTKGSFGEVDAAFQDLVQQLLEGRGTAESAAAAIEALGEANPDFSALQSKIAAVIQNFIALRQAAVAATRLDDVGSFPSMAEFNGEFKPPTPVKPVSIADYTPPTSGGGGSGKKGGGGGRSPGERFNEALEDQQRRIAELQRETELRRQLGATYDENGFAAERLRVQLDLENEAARAGLELTPQRAAAIEEVASAYARASVEAEQLKQAQDMAADAMQNFADVAESGLRGFIDDLIEGKSATEALGNALASIGNALLDFGLNSLFSMLMPGRGGGIASLFQRRERGGPVTAGKPYIVGEKRPEIFVPNQSGRIIPRIPTMPSAGAAAASGGGSMSINVDVTGARGNTEIMQMVQAGVSAGLKGYDKQLPGKLRDINQRTG
ncbi:tape measure protein [Devosia submarina]|uniref:tape measure protein n=1 Tax=Devosia submarina TaxID=1173082 RepID=UPI000D3D0C61|nr:tape measure protein [Devosia submarina]